MITVLLLLAAVPAGATSYGAAPVVIPTAGGAMFLGLWYMCGRWAARAEPDSWKQRACRRAGVFFGAIGLLVTGTCLYAFLSTGDFTYLMLFIPGCVAGALAGMAIGAALEVVAGALGAMRGRKDGN